MKISYKTGQIRKFLFIGLIMLFILPPLFLFLNWSINYLKHKASPELGIKSIEYRFCDIYSERLKQDLVNFISKYILECKNFWTLNQQKLYSTLKNKFKIIKLFDCRIDEKSNPIITITGWKPFCIINGDKILSKSNMLFPIDFFRDLNLLSLPNLSAKNINTKIQQDFVDEAFYEFAHKITKFHWDNFEINYVKPSEIRLYPKNNTFHCILLTRDKTFFDYEKIERALQLSQKVASDKHIQKKLLCKSKKAPELDLRFKSCIVVRAKSEDKEGDYEEKIIQ